MVANVPPDALGQAPDGTGSKWAIRVPAGSDRFQEQRKVFGLMPIDYKVLASDTNGSVLILEHTDNHKGGPPRHLHYKQEEWFYVLNSPYVMEIGDENYSLNTDDSVLAPRNVPHVWAYVGEAIGRRLIAFQPAGQMEAFFSQATKLKGIPAQEELQKLMRAHGMALTGPPCQSSKWLRISLQSYGGANLLSMRRDMASRISISLDCGRTS